MPHHHNNNNSTSNNHSIDKNNSTEIISNNKINNNFTSSNNEGSSNNKNNNTSTEIIANNIENNNTNSNSININNYNNNNNSTESLIIEIENQVKHLKELEKQLKLKQEQEVKKNKKKLLLVMDRSLFRGDVYGNQFKNCPHLNCELTHTRTRGNESDGILYFLPRYFKPGHRYYEVNRTSEEQLLFGWTMESPAMYPFLSNDTFIKENFNVTVGYSRYDYSSWKEEIQSSHILTAYGPVPYNGSNHYAWRHGFNNLTEIPKIRENKVMWMCGNCYKDKIGRADFVGKMMNLTQIDSYGRCLKNKELSENFGGRVQFRSIQKIQVLQNYTFTVAVENSRCYDYVTEKLWEPLSYGVIPIYLGAPNINDFLPDPNAIINIENYSSVEELMDYVDQVYKNETLYLKHLQWKSKPFPEKFKKILKQSENDNDLFCNICERLTQVSNNSTRFVPLDHPFKKCLLGRFDLPLFKNGSNVFIKPTVSPTINSTISNSTTFNHSNITTNSTITITPKTTTYQNSNNNTTSNDKQKLNSTTISTNTPKNNNTTKEIITTKQQQTTNSIKTKDPVIKNNDIIKKEKPSK